MQAISAHSANNKVLLMGKARAGKTSMKSIIFANYLAKDTERLGPTIKIAHSTLRFLGDLQLDLWDCGGQDKFLQSYFEAHRDSIFRNVAVLIYVFDVQSLQTQKNAPAAAGLTNDMLKFEMALGAMREHSPGARIFVLVHKMDTVARQLRDEVFNECKEQLIKRANTYDCKIECDKTSIWDESLFAAWSKIVGSLLMDRSQLEESLKKLRELCKADEIVLYESSTLLLVCSAENPQKKQPDKYRHEKIANIVKQFKLRCSQGSLRFNNMKVSNKHFCAYIGTFTPTTNILVVLSDTNVEMEGVMMNIDAAKQPFTKLLTLHVADTQG